MLILLNLFSDIHTASTHLSRVPLNSLILGFLSLSKLFASLRVSSVVCKFCMWVGLPSTASAAESRNENCLLSSALRSSHDGQCTESTSKQMQGG